MDGFKFKSTFTKNGIRNFELIDESSKQRKGGAISSQQSDTRADSGVVQFGGDNWEQYYELENSSHFLGDPNAYLLHDDTLRVLSIDGRKMSEQQKQMLGLDQQPNEQKKIFFNQTQQKASPQLASQ